MAELRVDGDQVTVVLSRGEHLEGVHGNVSFNVDRVRTAAVIDHPIGAVGLRDLKLAGTFVPGMTAVGTFKRGPARLFLVAHHKSARGLRIELDDGPFDEIVLGLDDPEAALAALEAARGA